jgi:hypothetical protein
MNDHPIPSIETDAATGSEASSATTISQRMNRDTRQDTLQDGRLRLALVSACVAVAGFAACTTAVAEPSARGNSISIVVIPTARAQGISLFRILVSGFVVELRHGPYRGSQDSLFIFPGQTSPCAVDEYAEKNLQTDGQGYQYTVGPGAFSVTVTGFASDKWRYGHICAYLAPLNFGLSDRGGIPLGPLAARTQATVNVAHPANPGV